MVVAQIRRKQLTLVHTAVREVRSENGPGLLRLTVPRLSGHSSVDNQAYKAKEELATEWQEDPIAKLHDYLVPTLMRENEWENLRNQVKRDVAKARDEAKQQPHGDPATVTQYVFSDPERPQQGGRVGGRRD